MNSRSRYNLLFENLINCRISAKADWFSPGTTKKKDLPQFVETFMEQWVRQFPNSLLVNAPLQLLRQRMVTIDEYERLFKPLKDETNEPIFRLLSISHEEKRRKVAAVFRKDMQSYLKLMEIMNPRLAFFFSGRQST